MKHQINGDGKERQASARSTGSTPPSSSDERDSFYKGRNRYARSKSPARPPRPRQTLIKHALTPNLSPAISPYPNSQGTTEDDGKQEEYSPTQKNGSESDTPSSTASNSPTRRSTSPKVQDRKSSSDDGALVSALLKVILKSGSTEMKAHLTDIMIDNPALAERLKEAKDQ